MDVVSAFLNGELKEEIYMKQPPGYVQSGKENLACKLRKSIYGLKQSPHCWNHKLCDHLKSLGFKESGADSCVFVKNESSTLKIIAVYVDDLILIAKSLSEIQQMKDSLSKTFKMTDMGQIRYCLGINFELTEQGISLCQKQYLIKLLERYKLAEANTVTTPMDPNVKLVKDDSYSKKVDAAQYQSMVGCLLHAARATCPDIAYAVGIVSKFNAAPIQAHLTAVKRIFRYLKGLSQKQTTVALSTAEAEYVALGSAIQEAIWLYQLLNDLKIDTKGSIEIMEDNQSTKAKKMSTTLQKIEA